jgi:NAD(P)-dependent dehydrogenase (short-subunit alcohol dehydrogenase family)
MEDFRGKTAVITGAASGIGRALAEQAVVEGMRVLIADVDAEALERTRAALDTSGSTIVCAVVDVADAQAVEALAERAWRELGGVHLLFNNAGVMVGGFSWERSLADWRWVLDVNLWGVIHGIRAFVPRMIARGEAAHVINTASVAALVAGPLLSPYLASKHAVLAITESLHHELALVGSPVRAALLCPGAVRTGIGRSERTRPTAHDERGRRGDADTVFEQTLIAGIEAGSAPRSVAGFTFEALREDRFWILPHPEFKRLVDKRARSIIDETNPTYERDLI